MTIQAAYRRSEAILWQEAAERIEPSVYGEKSTNWPLIALIVALHVAAIGALVKLDVIHVVPHRAVPTVVTLLPDIAPPPPSADVPKPPKAVEPRLAPPVAIVQTPAPAPLAMAPAPEVPVVAAIAPAAPAAPPAPVKPVTLDAMAATLSGDPPSYPIESRRKKEQGTVVLRVLIGTDGRPEDVSLARSSGFERLDKAALAAVRKWRFRPPMRDGAPAEGVGTLEIPFQLI